MQKLSSAVRLSNRAEAVSVERDDTGVVDVYIEFKPEFITCKCVIIGLLGYCACRVQKSRKETRATSIRDANPHRLRLITVRLLFGAKSGRRIG